MARRLNLIAINGAQKGFRPIFYCLANIVLQTTIVRTMLAHDMPHTVVTLDIKKALDTVSPTLCVE